MNIATDIKQGYDDILMALAEANKLAVDVEHDYDNEISLYTFNDDSKLKVKFSDTFKTSSFEVVNA